MFESSISPRTAGRIYLVLLIVGAFAWRVHGLTNQSLWRDEVDAIYFALRDLPQTLSMFVQSGQNGPLYFLTLRPWFHLVGASEFTLRYPSVLAGVLTIPLLWQVTRRLLFGRQSPVVSGQSPIANRRSPVSALSLLTCTFLAFNPYQLWYSQEGKMYTVITALALLTTWFWLKGMDAGGWRVWVGYWISVSLAMYCHLLMVLLIPLHGLWFVIAWPHRWAIWRGYGLALMGLTLPYLPMLWWHWDLLTTPEKKTGFHFTPLPEMLRSLLLNHTRGFLPLDELIWFAPVFFLGLAGLALGLIEWPTATSNVLAPSVTLASWQRFVLLITWLYAPILGIYALSLRQPVFTDRYVIWVSPAAMLLLALGALVVQRNAGLWGRPLASILVIYILGFWLYAGWQQKMLPMKYDLRSGVSYVAARRAVDELLILQIPHMEWSYRYYSNPDHSASVFATSDAHLGQWVGGLWTNGEADDEQARREVDQQMNALTARAKRIWVLRSEVEMWDARHLMDEWLEQHGQVIDRAEFHGVQVKAYELKQQRVTSP
jgi:uncharacterized membrane protein